MCDCTGSPASRLCTELQSRAFPLRRNAPLQHSHIALEAPLSLLDGTLSLSRARAQVRAAALGVVVLFSVDFFSSPFASPPSLSLSVCALSLRPWLSLPDLFAKVPLYPAALHALGVLYKSAYIFLFLFFLKCWLHYQYTHTHTHTKKKPKQVSLPHPLFLRLFDA